MNFDRLRRPLDLPKRRQGLESEDSMGKSNPQKISEAIRKLEDMAEGRANGHDSGQIAEDLENIKKSIEDLKPHFQKLKNDLGCAAGETFDQTIRQVRERGAEVERQVRDNPWWALGLAGLIAFFIGYLLGRKD